MIIHSGSCNRSFNEIGLEIFSIAIFFLPLIKRQLSVTYERMCTECWLTAINDAIMLLFFSLRRLSVTSHGGSFILRKTID